jgi:hypothetical protein
MDESELNRHLKTISEQIPVLPRDFYQSVWAKIRVAEAIAIREKLTHFRPRIDRQLFKSREENIAAYTFSPKKHPKPAHKLTIKRDANQLFMITDRRLYLAPDFR